MSFRNCAVLILGYFCTSSAVVANGPSLASPSLIVAAAMASPPGPLAPPPAPAEQDVATAPVVVAPDQAPVRAEPHQADASKTEPPEAAAPLAKLAMNSIVLPLSPQAPPPPAPTAPPIPARPATRADVDALLSEMHTQLAGTLLPDAPPLTHAALAAAHTMLQKAHVAPDTMQVVIVVDRSPKVQRLWVTVAAPGASTLEPLGSVHVSTGKPGRKEHFRTPVGVFINDTSILGYRAQGTYNENHIRGIGLRGMRVWDFGWQTTDDWRTLHALMAVRMEMHATDPSVLEPRLGRWDSEGCIRIPTRFNSFLDLQGLIDAKQREAAQDDRRFAALLPKHTVPSPLAGQTLVVVDTSDPDAAPSDPAKAHLIAHPAVTGPEHDDAS